MKIRYDMVNCFVIRPSSSRGWEVLQLHRVQDDFMGGTWQPIYGTSENGESPAVAIIREMQEETGLAPDELFQLNDVDVFYIAAGETMWHCICFCAIVNREATVQLNAEHDAVRWIDVETAEEHFMWPGNRRAIEEIKTQIIGNGLAKSFMRITSRA